MDTIDAMDTTNTVDTKNDKYRITVHTDEQLSLLQKVSECFLRERMGQFDILAEDLATEGCGYIYDKTDPDNKQKFDAYIDRRNEALDYFNRAYRISGADQPRNEAMNQAGDFFTTIRHAIWLDRPEPKPHGINDAYSSQWSEQDPPKCYRADDGSSPPWILEMSRTQILLLQNMSENYMRERMGQFWLLTEDLSYERAGFHYDKDNPENDRRFKECASNAQEAKVLFEQGYRTSGAAAYSHKTKSMMMAYDFYSTIRHALWLENPDPNNHLASGKPLHECAEVPLIEVEKV